MNIQTKKIFSAIVLCMLFGFALMPLEAGGAGGNPAGLSNDFNRDIDALKVDSFIQTNPGNVAGDPRLIIKRIINVVMGFLGMLAILIILFAGFKWMTAAGNKENMEAAAKMLRDGVIGLIIIFSAWTLAWFVVNTIKINVRT